MIVEVFGATIQELFTKEPRLLEHFVMDAVLFLITGIRYFWGPPIDLTRLTLFLVAGWAVIGDMDLYYNWPIMLPAISYSDRGLIAKYLLAVGVAVDILKDWWKVRQMGFFRDIHRMSKET